MQVDQHDGIGTIAAAAGFVLMTALDVALGWEQWRKRDCPYFLHFASTPSLPPLAQKNRMPEGIRREGEQQLPSFSVAPRKRLSVTYDLWLTHAARLRAANSRRLTRMVARAKALPLRGCGQRRRRLVGGRAHHLVKQQVELHLLVLVELREQRTGLFVPQLFLRGELTLALVGQRHDLLL